MRSEICYDAVILYSDKDGQPALHVKTWLENHLFEKPPHGGLGFSLKIELMGSIDCNYVDSLETACKRTKIIIILYTKQSGDDARFKKAIHALWTWQAEKHFQIIHLLVDFEEGSPPECITLSDAHILRFDKDRKYLCHLLTTHLSRALQVRLQHEETREKHGKKEASDSRLQGGDCRSAGIQLLDTTGREVALTPKADAYDSGLASVISSDLTSSPSAHSPSQAQHSLSGPFALSRDDLLEDSTSTGPSAPEVKAKAYRAPSTYLSGFSDSGVRSEGADTNMSGDGSNCAERHADEDRESKEIKGLNTSKAVAVTVSTKTEYVCIEQNQISRTEDRIKLTKHTSNSQATVPSEQIEGSDENSTTFNGTENLQTAFTSVSDQLISPMVAHNPDVEEQGSNRCAENLMTDAVPGPRADVHPNCENCEQTPLMKQGKSELQTDGQQLNDSAHILLTTATNQNQIMFETSNAESKSDSVKATKEAESSTEDCRRKDFKETVADVNYLTPVHCETEGKSCQQCHNPGELEDCQELDPAASSCFGNEGQSVPERDSSSSNRCARENCQPLISLVETAESISSMADIPKHEVNNSGKRKQLLDPALVEPPSHGYTNAVSRDGPGQTRTNFLPARAQPFPSAMNLCNPLDWDEPAPAADTDLDYYTTDCLTTPSASEFFPRTINIHRARSVFINGTSYQLQQAEILTPTNNERSSDATDTYPSWPLKETDHLIRASHAKPAADHAEAAKSPQPLTSLGLSQPPDARGRVRSTGDYRIARDLVYSSLGKADPGAHTPVPAAYSGLYNWEKRKSPRIPILSSLRALMCCSKKRTKKKERRSSKVQTRELEAWNSPGDDENNYEIVIFGDCGVPLRSDE